MRASEILSKLPTDRESEIINFVADFRHAWQGRGATTKDIAERLKAPPRAVAQEVQSLLTRGYLRYEPRQGLDAVGVIDFAGEID